MNIATRPAFDAARHLEEGLTVLALRLRHEVALHRALRGDGTREGFSGLLLDGNEAEQMLLQMAGRLEVSGTAETLAVIEGLEAKLAENRKVRGSIWARLETVFDLSDLECDLLFLATAAAIDPRFGRVFGFLSDDLTRRYLTPALALRLVQRHQIGLTNLRAVLRPESALIRHGLITMGPDRPMIEAPLRVEEDVIDWLLGGAVETGPALAVPPGGPWLSDRLDRLDGRPLSVLAWSELNRCRDPVSEWRRHQRQAHLNGFCPVLESRQATTLAERRAISGVTGPGAALVGSDLQGWVEAGFPTQTNAPDGPGVAARLHRDRALAGLAEPLQGTLTLDDIVLPARHRAALTDLVEAAGTMSQVLTTWRLGEVWGKALGLTSLFKGPSGTGKTTAAAAIGLALGLPVYRVNLAGLISKYIGETEKHLDRLFDAAEGQDIILFFDEADAVFGKRSEVHDAHDRYANTGTAYLLQRLERHSGLTILATNLSENIDEAFLRRIDAVIDFPAPGAPEREALWQRIALSKAPLAALDYKALAAHVLTGGEIRNCCLTAAYRAAQAGGPITMEGLAQAIAQELTKKGKPVRRADFGDLYTARKGAR